MKGLRHARQQRSVAKQLSATCAGCCSIEPLEVEVSLAWCARIASDLEMARSGCKVLASKHSSVDAALDVLEHAGVWSDAFDGIIQLALPDGTGSGFYNGALSRDALRQVVGTIADGFVVVDTVNSGAFCLDLVLDDPQEGDFVELEKWELRANH